MQTMDGERVPGATNTVGRDAVRVALATAALLLVPLVAMRFTGEVAWSGVDFVVAAVLLAGAGITCVRVARRLRGAAPWQRLAVPGALVLAFAAVWIELAVGVFFNLGS